MQVVLAARARYRIAPDGDAIEVELTDGELHEGVPGALDWRISRFATQRLRLPVPQARLPGRPRVDALENHVLLASPQPQLRAELHWRTGWVAAVLLLGMLAVPLGRLSPRQGRHARVPIAILLFAVHAGLLTSGRTLLERGEIPAQLGLWWAHAAVLGLALLVVGVPRIAGRLARARNARG
jgi:lipopolysaccharide export system permease protein